MGRNLELLVIAARQNEPKALDLDSFADRSMEVALIAVAAMAGAALLASAIQLLGLSWNVALLGLPGALIALAFTPVLAVAAPGSVLLAAYMVHHWQRLDRQRGGVEA